MRKAFYPLKRSLAEIQPTYQFDSSCQGTVPESIQAFIESMSFEEAIRNAIWLGGDADTMGAITGSIAWAYYAKNGSVDEQMRTMAMATLSFLPDDLRGFVTSYENRLAKR
ncbi:ADP-ribosylglycohydrolase [Arcanobacterium wilhelmae]|uniref:ADP-ribosylglycohydrolase n=2 Tax=Arcanobacterium wilhelmae TaxID=1803177 RepID=A0ABT9NDC9_9ACTO|nr:ADP-ribosylglycohydrolase [Arcanobacterium wilhelmae]